MKISVQLDREDEEDSPATNVKESKLQGIQERLRSQRDPYYSSKNVRRRGGEGVGGTSKGTVDGTPQEQTPSFATKLLSFGRGRGVSPNEENGSLLGNVLSVATTPLRAAWGMVASRSSPLQKSVEKEDRMVNVSREGMVEDITEIDRKEDSCIGEAVKERTPSPQAAVERPDSPKMHTPFDGVLGMLKQGPLAGGTPHRFPSPKKSTVKGIQTMPRPAIRREGIATPAFTFDSTKKNLTSLQKFRNSMNKTESTPQNTLGVQKSMVFGSKRGSMAARGSPTPSLAWTPLRATPLAQTTTSRLFTNKSRLGTQEVSRKRRADDVHGMTPSVEDGSVSLLDMQRRRRFRPSEDPGSTHRRSWRAGRTPYRHVSNYRRRIDSATEEKHEQAAVETSSSPKPTSETARRILETLESMEKSIKKSKESLTPGQARKYTETATPAPPPGTSLGGAMLPSNEPESKKQEPKLVLVSEKKPTDTVVPEQKEPAVIPEQKQPVFTFATKKPAEEEPAKVVISTGLDNQQNNKPSSTEEIVQVSKKSKRKATEDIGPGAKTSPIPQKPQTPAFGFLAPKPSLDTQDSPKVDETGQLYTFGKTKNTLKDSVSKVVQNVLPATSDQAKFLFGKDKVSKDEEETKIAEPASGGWGSDFLKKNSQAAAEVTAAVEKETSEKSSGPASTFAFGTASPAIKFGATTSEKRKEENQAALPTAGWGSDFLQKNATAAAEVTAAVEKEVNKDAAPASTGVAPSFTFGASSSPAPTASFQFGSTPTEEKKPEETKPASATGGWGSDFLQKNATAAAEVTAAVEKEVNKDAAPASTGAAPSFTFGASSSPAPTASFQFGSTPTKEKKPEETKPAVPSGGWGTGISNNSTAGDLTAQGKSDTPSFKFGSSGQMASTEPAKTGTPGFGGAFGTQTTGNSAAMAPPQGGFTFGQPSGTSGASILSSGPGSGEGQNAQFAFGASSSQSAAPIAFGSAAPATTGALGGSGGPQIGFGGVGTAGNTSFGNPTAGFGNTTGGFGNTTGGFGNTAGGFGNTTGGFETQNAGFGSSGFGSSAPAAAPFGTASSAAAFGGQPATNPFGNANAFGQPGSGQFGAPQSTGFGGGFAGPSAFPQPSAAGQMIPNQDNPFGGGMPSAGGFSLGSSGNTTSEGRRKVKVKRRAR